MDQQKSQICIVGEPLGFPLPVLIFYSSSSTFPPSRSYFSFKPKMPKSERYYSQQYSLLGYPSSNPSATGILQDLYPSNLSNPDVAHEPPPPSYTGYDSYKSQDDASSFDQHEPVRHEPVQAQPLTYDNLRSYDDHNHNPLNRPKKAGWSRRRKIIIFGSIAAFILVIAIVVGVAVALTHTSPYKYTPSIAHVTNQEAFTTGGATNNSPQDTADGIGAGQDKYLYYTGTSSSFPSHDSWISFSDMWSGNLPTLQTSCSVLGEGKDNSKSVIQDIYDAIQNRSAVSLVDHRFIFATILQEVR